VFNNTLEMTQLAQFMSEIAKQLCTVYQEKYMELTLTVSSHFCETVFDTGL